MIIATAGHVDHGKTSLVRALTGIDTDRLAEERRRGLTIEPGFAYVDAGADRWGFVDVPGHHRFVGNMLSGVAGVDAALLVVAADDGPMPQTREHLAILDLLDIHSGVVAVTKTDLVPAARLQAIEAELDELLAGSTLAAAPRIPVSSVTGAGLDDLRGALAGQTGNGAARNDGDGLRFAIDRAFTVRGTGLVVTGCVHSGQIRVGDELRVVPGDRPARVRGLRVLDREATEGGVGERVAINIAGPDAEGVARGHWLLGPEIAHGVQRFDARLRVLEGVQIRSGMAVHLHHGASHSLGRITVLDGPEDRPRVHLSSREPLAVFHGDRLVLRDASASITLAGARVLDPLPPARGRSRPQRLQALDALELDRLEQIVPALLAVHPDGLLVADLALRLNVVTARIIVAAGDAVVEAGEPKRIRQRAAWDALRARIVDALRRFHAGHPQLAGMGIDELRAVLDPRPSPELLQAAVGALTREGVLARSATRHRLPDHVPALAASDQPLWNRLQPVLAAQPTQPPVVHDLARALQLQPGALGELLARVHHTGGVIRVADNRFMLPAGVALLAAAVERAAAAAPEQRFDARSYRDTAGIGRNLAIDMLEFFDRNGLTRRLGDVRIVVGSASELFGSADAAER